MWGIKEVFDDQGDIIAFSARYLDDEFTEFTEYANSPLNDRCGLICLYSKDIMTRDKIFSSEILNARLKEVSDPTRLVFLSNDAYMDVSSILEHVRISILKLKEVTNCKEIYLYIPFDFGWNNLEEKSKTYIVQELKSMAKELGIEIVVIYLTEEIDKSNIRSMFGNYEPEFYIKESQEALITSYACRSIGYECNTLKGLGESVDEFIHDINNLLVSIVGYAQYLMEIEDKDEIESSLNKIFKLALDGKNSLNALKNGTKDIPRLSKDIYKFNDIINDSIDMAKGKLKTVLLDNENDLKFSINLSLDKYIYGNEYTLRHAIMNIISNGIDAMGNSGVLTINTYDKDNMIYLEISDTGSGIDELQLAKIFKPYYTTKGSNGTGLGLCIAKEVFEGHFGKIYVESKIGKGTKFTISLPSAELKEMIEDSSIKQYNTT